MNRYFLVLSAAFLFTCATQLQAARVYNYTYGGSPIQLPANPVGNGVANPNPADIVVAGAIGTILDVSVTLSGFSHTVVREMSFYLRGPGAGSSPDSVWLFGGIDTTVAGTTLVNLTFVDGASVLPENNTGALASGTYGPQESYLSTGLSYSPLVLQDSFSDAFLGDDPNGTWSLFAWDSADFDGGVLDSWQLSITTNAAPWSGGSPGSSGSTGSTPEPTTGMVALLAMAGLAFVRRRR